MFAAHLSERIWLPFCANNSQFLMTYSDDDGRTWQSQTQPPKDLTSIIGKPAWFWIGNGPPAGIQLESGRLLIPAYHGPFHWDDGSMTSGFVYYSDDHGATWQRGGEYGSYEDPRYWSNEVQAVDLGNNVVLVSARGILIDRLISYSTDGGNTFGPMEYAQGLVQPFDGCEGSTILQPKTGLLYYTGVTPAAWTPLRYNFTFHVSADQGKSWKLLKVLDPGAAAYSAMVIMDDYTIGVLYERASITRTVFIPDYISFQIIDTKDLIEDIGL